MRTRIKLLFCLLFIIFTLVGCNSEVITPTGYYLDKDNNLIAVYENEETNLGHWGDDIISKLESINISEDGTFVINGIKTSIKTRIANYYSLNNEGHLIVTYLDKTTEDLGDLGDTLINGIDKVEISEEGFFIINDVRTGIFTKIASAYTINNEGHLIVSYNNQTDEDLGDLSTILVKGIKSVSISNDGFFVINEVKTNITTKVPKNYSINTNGHLIVTYLDNSTEDLGDFSTSVVNGIKTIFIDENGYYKINGVTTTIQAIEMFSVSFNTGTNQKIDTQKIKDGYKVTKPTLVRTGYTFLGWFYNDEEWHFNSDVVKSNMTLIAKWQANEYNVSFVNEKGEAPSEVIAIYDSNIALPQLDDITGYAFDGWYNGTTKVSNGNWSITSDVTLKAKWSANTYTITLNPGAGVVSKTTISAKYGESYSVPVPTNSYGIFTGWLLDGNAITDKDGKSLSNWDFTENKTFTYEWKYKITSVNDLIQLKDNIELINQTKTSTDQTSSLVLSIENDIDFTGINWEPFSIGKVIIEGNNHSIKNLTSTKGGLFSELGYVYTNATKIKDLNFENVNINVTSLTEGKEDIGFFVCSLANQVIGSINNVNVLSGSIIVNQEELYDVIVCGIVGRCYGITNCKNYATISSNTPFANGICYTNQGETSKCVNYGAITAGNLCVTSQATMYSTIGAASGITGLAYGNITDCYNLGKVSAFFNASGIAGMVEGEIHTSANKANITSSNSNAYGIASSVLFDGTISNVDNCYNTGNISGNNYAAGICERSSIQNCYNIGIVKGNTYYTGGISIVGPIIIRCCNIDSKWVSSNYSSNVSIIQCEAFNNDYSIFESSLKYDETVWNLSESNFPTLKVEVELLD